MTAAHSVVKRRKIDTVFLGAIGQSEESHHHHPIPATANSSSRDARNFSDPNQPSTSTPSTNVFPTNFANFGRNAVVVKRNSAEMAPPSFRPESNSISLLVGGGNSLQEFPLAKANGLPDAELRNSSLAMDFSTGDLSMDSDVFAMSVTKTSSKATAFEIEQSEIPEINEAIRIRQRSIPPETKFNRFDAKTATIIEPIPTVQKEISVQLKRRNDCSICELRALSQGASATAKGLLKCGRISARVEHTGVCWEVVVKAGVTLLHANHDWTIGACENRELVILRTRTGKLQRTLRFESPIVIALLDEGVCLVILANAELSTIHLETGESIVQSSLACVLRTPDVKVLHYAVTDRGIPMIMASNEECVVYSKSMGAWLSVNVGVDSMSSFVAPMKFVASVAPNGLIALLAKQKSTEKVNFNPETNANCEEMQFEALLEACRAIESWVEFRFLLQIYVQKLMTRGKREKLVETLEEIRKCNSTNSEFDKILEDVDSVLREFSTNYEKLLADGSEEYVNLSFID